MCVRACVRARVCGGVAETSVSSVAVTSHKRLEFVLRGDVFRRLVLFDDCFGEVCS